MHSLKQRKALALYAVLLTTLIFIAACTTTPPTPAAGQLGGAGAPEQIAEVTSSAPDAPPTADPTIPSTFTPVPTLTETPTPGATPTPTITPTPSPTPSPTAPPSPSPTSAPQGFLRFPVYSTPVALLTATPATPIPTPVAPFNVPDSMTNILLLAHDEGGAREDTIIIVAVDRETKTASMVSLPRDLYVYHPDRTQMGRINSAGSIPNLRRSILYNFGVPIHYYGLVEIEGFKEIVDALGGITVPVSCPVDIPLAREPEPDEETCTAPSGQQVACVSYEPGIYEMDGDFALWYARTRLGSSDFERGRRQQTVLRAILNKGVDLNMIAQAPQLYEAYQDTVETDMDLGRMLQLASIAPAVRDNGVQHLYVVGRNQLQPWRTPGGAAVQLPRWEYMQDTFYRLFIPPALNRSTRAPIYVEIVNGTDNEDLARLAADNLTYYGFVPVISEPVPGPVDRTTISYYGQNLKGSFDWLISWIFNRRDYDIELVPDTPYDYEYRVVLGHDFDPCLNPFGAPRAFLP